MPNAYTVIGHGRDNHDALLLLGDDGQHYAYDVLHDRLAPVQVDDGWIVEGGAAPEGADLSADPDVPLP